MWGTDICHSIVDPHVRRNSTIHSLVDPQVKEMKAPNISERYGFNPPLKVDRILVALKATNVNSER